MSGRSYYIIIAFGRRLDSNRFDYLIAGDEENFGLYNSNSADNRIYTFRLELEKIFYIDDDFRIEIRKFVIQD